MHIVFALKETILFFVQKSVSITHVRYIKILTSMMMTPRLSGLYSIFGLVFFVLKSLPGIARQWSRETFVILFLKPGLILEF